MTTTCSRGPGDNLSEINSGSEKAEVILLWYYLEGSIRLLNYLNWIKIVMKIFGGLKYLLYLCTIKQNK